MRLNNVSKLCLAASFAVSILAAGDTPAKGVAPASRIGVIPVTIGVATALGPFKINSSDVQGNANVFDGSELRTGHNASQVLLQSGAALTLGINSMGTVFHDHLVLQEGSTRIDNMGNFSVRAAMYRVHADQPATKALVRLTADDVEIAALTGSLAISNEKGVLLTHVGAGTASAFNKNPQLDQAGNPPPNYENRTRTLALYALLITSMAGLGLAVDAILQSGPYTGPISP